MSGPEEARVIREKAAYEQGLKRGEYNEALAFTHYHYRQKRVRLAGQILRDAPHQAVLELGCAGWLHLIEPSGIMPEKLISIEISERELERYKSAAESSRLKPDFRLMDAHQLDFPAHSFDVVCGMSVLHHLNLQQALAEIHRVLKPGGLLLFTEPLDINPLGRLVRLVTPHARTVDERPFRMHDLSLIKQYFDCEFHYEQLISVAAGVVSKSIFSKPDNPLTRAGFWFDELVVRTVPYLRYLYRSVIIAGHPRPMLAYWGLMMAVPP